jgi:hypothetical protein
VVIGGGAYGPPPPREYDEGENVAGLCGGWFT